MIQPELSLLFTDHEKNLTMSKMKKIFKTVVFVVGVDVLGFPQVHRHFVAEYYIIDSSFFKAFSKN